MGDPSEMPVTLSEDEVEFSAIRAQGPGGQNVNKVSCAVHLRFDIRASSLPGEVKERLLAMPDQRISRDGVVVIKAQNARSLEKNRAEALRRLQALVDEAFRVQPIRRPTKPTFGSKQRRLEGKARRAGLKVGRAKVLG
jgi:ribosome-associated protein